MTSASPLLGLSEEVLRCDQEIERRYEIVPSVVCSMCCLFGIIYCFFGEQLYEQSFSKICGVDLAIVAFTDFHQLLFYLVLS